MQLIFISGSLRRSSRQVAGLAGFCNTFTRTFVHFYQLDNSLNDIAFGKIVATGYSITIYFEKEFSEIPIVIATCVASGADRTVTVSNITKSECTFYAWMNGNAVSGSVINWIAIGK